MVKTIQLGEEITVLCNPARNGSEVLLFQRNSGLIGRVNVRETGEELEKKLRDSIRKILDKRRCRALKESRIRARSRSDRSLSRVQ